MLIDSKYRIIITDGYQTDENNALDELIIPSHVKRLDAPSKVTFLGKILNWIPSTKAKLQNLEAPNAISFGSYNFFSGYNLLTSIRLPSVTAINDDGRELFMGCTGLLSVTMDNLASISNTGYETGPFINCASLNEINLPNLTNINDKSGRAGTFYGCSALQSITFPELINIYHKGSFSTGATFMGCSGLQTVNFPKLAYMTCDSGGGIFTGCTGLQDVTLGSQGHPVNTIKLDSFKSCTQANLTITVYTTGGASLANEPWGATNATIVYETA